MLTKKIMDARLRGHDIQNQPLTSIVLICIFLSSTATAQPATSKALKLAVAASRQTIYAGDTVEVEVKLRNANDQTVNAAKEMTVTVSARKGPAVLEKKEITIKAGASSQKLRLALNEPGLIYLWASHNELLEAGVNIMVRSQKNAPLPSPAPPVPAMPESSEEEKAPSEVVLPPLQPKLTLRYSPQRRFLADGKDRATIQAFVLNAEEFTPGEIRLRLFNSAGNMTPQPLVIPQGEDIGAATLTSDRVDTVEVEFLSATPPSALEESEKKLEIPFAPPITQLDLRASPPLITLVDKAELIARLLDENSNPVATDQPRQISLAIDTGRGEVESGITIPAGQFEGRATFLPTWRGEVVLSASTSNLPTDTSSLQVTLPLVLLSLSAAGGLVGGLIAFWIGKDSKWWRIAIGLVTGFVLYWAFIFGVLGVLPRAVVLNPLSAFVLSTLGGWLGTEVFAQILKRLGIGAAAENSSNQV